jgi:hypothetical protein
MTTQLLSGWLRTKCLLARAAVVRVVMAAWTTVRRVVCGVFDIDRGGRDVYDWPSICENVSEHAMTIRSQEV